MARWARGLWAVVFLFGLAACNDLAGIPAVVPCSTAADCAVAEPECLVSACEAGVCAYHAVLLGTPLAEQTAGDCVQRVCDGDGNAVQGADPADVPDDGNPCTEDTCTGGTPGHTPLGGEVACYSGPLETKGIGACKPGELACQNGSPAGACAGEVLPAEADDCATFTDENCDGQVNEACLCTPGTIQGCYSGPAGTESVGLCHGGTRICLSSGIEYGPCTGEITPRDRDDCDSALFDEDCDGQANEDADGAGCACVPGATVPCYTGAPGTEGVGPCKGGVRTCLPTGVEFGDCEGEITPGVEICDAAKTDENCSGEANEDLLDCTCGDGVLDPASEACDDGNTDDTDGCTNACKLPVCGDGVVQSAAGEACDDGNAGDTDGCTTQCKLPVCGDGFVQPGAGEECDDGGTSDADGCSSACKLRQVLAISAGQGASVCALLSGGRVKCWGDNSKGQLGLGDTDDRGDGVDGAGAPVLDMGSHLPAVDLGTETIAVAVSAGTQDTCAILQDGRVKCWGNNASGRLGLGDKLARGDGPGEMGDALPAVDLGATGADASQIQARSSTCALLNNHVLKCWGANGLGELGLGDKNARGDGPNEMGDSLSPVTLSASAAVQPISIAAGGHHNCALLSGGAVKCWGANSAGQLGLGDTHGRGDGPNEMGDALPAVSLGAGRTAIQVRAGEAFTCALLDDGRVKCWGDNSSGQLGIGTFDNRGDGPNEMGDALPAVDFGAGVQAQSLATGYKHACAILKDGAVKCWGENGSGQLGIGSTVTKPAPPDGAVALGVGRGATALALGSAVSCALLDDRSVKCWGDNSDGQLGLGLPTTERIGDVPGEMGDNLPAVKLFSEEW